MFFNMVLFTLLCSTLWFNKILCRPSICEQTRFVVFRLFCSIFTLSQTLLDFHLISPRLETPKDIHLVHCWTGEGSWLLILLGSLPMPQNYITPLFFLSPALLPVPKLISSIQWPQVHSGNHLFLTDNPRRDTLIPGSSYSQKCVS